MKTSQKVEGRADSRGEGELFATPSGALSAAQACSHMQPTFPTRSFNIFIIKSSSSNSNISAISGSTCTNNFSPDDGSHFPASLHVIFYLFQMLCVRPRSVQNKYISPRKRTWPFYFQAMSVRGWARLVCIEPGLGLDAAFIRFILPLDSRVLKVRWGLSFSVWERRRQYDKVNVCLYVKGRWNMLITWLAW